MFRKRKLKSVQGKTTFPLNEYSKYKSYIISSKENWIEGGGDRVSVHFAVTFLDCWITSFCVTAIIKIVNNNTNDKQTSGISGALDVCLH